MFLRVTSALGCSGLAVVGLLGFDVTALLFMLFNVFLHCSLPISSFNINRWSSRSFFLQLVQVDPLSPVVALLPNWSRIRHMALVVTGA